MVKRDVRRGEYYGGAGVRGVGDLQQLSEVSQHTASASNAMRHLVAEITQLREK